jgi:hypothetical protein
MLPERSLRPLQRQRLLLEEEGEGEEEAQALMQRLGAQSCSCCPLLTLLLL